jgi:hypothetical protein
MRKIGIAVLCLAISGIFGATLSISSDNSEENMIVPMGIIVLQPPEGVEQKRSSVEFPHAVHFSNSCQVCHHTWEGTEQIKGCMTSGCHDLTEAQTKSKDPALTIRYYKKAYHEMCIGCHREIKASNKKLELSGRAIKGTLPATGPTGCIECHPKEE